MNDANDWNVFAPHAHFFFIFPCVNLSNSIFKLRHFGFISPIRIITMMTFMMRMMMVMMLRKMMS